MKIHLITIIRMKLKKKEYVKESLIPGGILRICSIFSSFHLKKTASGRNYFDDVSTRPA